VLEHYNKVRLDTKTALEDASQLSNSTTSFSSIRRNGGLNGAGERCYSSVFNLQSMNAKPCIYMRSQGSRNPILSTFTNIRSTRGLCACAR